MTMFSPKIMQTLAELNVATHTLNQSIITANPVEAIKAALEIRIAAGELRNELQRHPDAD